MARAISTLVEVSTGLAPDFNFIEVAAPYARTFMGIDTEAIGRASAEQQTDSMAPIRSQADHLRDAQHVEQHERIVMLPSMLAPSIQPDSIFLLTNTVVDDASKGHSPLGIEKG